MKKRTYLLILAQAAMMLLFVGWYWNRKGAVTSGFVLYCIYLIPAVLDLVALGEEFGAEWVTFGRRSKAGHPHHPLYLRADSAPEPFDVRAYWKGLQA